MASLLRDCSARSSIAICRTCTNSGSHTRLFSSTASILVGPESPNYIDIPRLIQPDLPRRPRIKGTLPVPREIFPPRRPDKPTESYIADATPLPTASPKLSPGHPQYEIVEWKRKMADDRRKNLRDGLLELYERKRNSQRTMAIKSRLKQHRRNQVLNQPRPDHDRLTAISSVEAMKPIKCKVLPNPNAEERFAQSIANVQGHQAAKREEVADSLHELYLNAQTFIVDEQKLIAEVDRVFPLENNPDWTNGRRAGESVWNLGPPPTMSQLAQQSTQEYSRWETIQRRTKKLAEELTGGKI